MATGGGAEEERKRGRPQLLPPARPAARGEEADGGREKMGWAQVVKNLADVSFRSAEKLALFLRVYEEKREQEDCWENFVVLGRSKSSLKTLFILFRNETVDVEDIVTWLKRHCDVLAVPVKVTDRFGIWTGEYKCEIELRQGEGGVRHLPGAFFLGAERGYSWYKGQPKTCFKCGSRTHMSGSCTQDRCFRCGEEGHLSPYCRKGIVCNLCGKRGHAFAQCPKAVHNSVAAQLTGVAGH
uniref:Isoform 2 of Zinc finger CCHC domain-containing protein 3 n=1 Tax=Homo sapiens TaxID=9606 RepID=Q9NUD5-2